MLITHPFLTLRVTQRLVTLRYGFVTIRVTIRYGIVTVIVTARVTLRYYFVTVVTISVTFVTVRPTVSMNLLINARVMPLAIFQRKKFFQHILQRLFLIIGFQAAFVRQHI